MRLGVSLVGLGVIVAEGKSTPQPAANEVWLFEEIHFQGRKLSYKLPAGDRVAVIADLDFLKRNVESIKMGEGVAVALTPRVEAPGVLLDLTFFYEGHQPTFVKLNNWAEGIVLIRRGETNQPLLVVECDGGKDSGMFTEYRGGTYTIFPPARIGAETVKVPRLPSHINDNIDRARIICTGELGYVRARLYSAPDLRGAVYELRASTETPRSDAGAAVELREVQFHDEVSSIEVELIMPTLKADKVGVVQLPPSALGQAAKIEGTYGSNLGIDFTLRQDGERFTWELPQLLQRAEGTIRGINLEVRWTDPNGQGEATGRVIESDAQGRATRIEWSNGVVMTRKTEAAVTLPPSNGVSGPPKDVEMDRFFDLTGRWLEINGHGGVDITQEGGQFTWQVLNSPSTGSGVLKGRQLVVTNAGATVYGLISAEDAAGKARQITFDTGAVYQRMQ